MVVNGRTSAAQENRKPADVADPVLAEMLAAMNLDGAAIDSALGTVELMGPLLERLSAGIRLSAKERKLFDLMRQGIPLADIAGLTQEDRDAMLLRGCRLIQAGHIKKARDWLTMLCSLYPFDARVVYAIASTHQIEGNFKSAAGLFLQSIFLDCKNPEPYLRMGECALATGNRQMARASFDMAKRYCEQGRGNARIAALAAKMLGEVDAQLNPA